MILALVLQAGLASAPATAGVAPQPSPAAVSAPMKSAAADQVDPNKKICKAESITGSRLGGFKVCMTKADWDARSADEGSRLSGMQLNSRNLPQ